MDKNCEHKLANLRYYGAFQKAMSLIWGENGLMRLQYCTKCGLVFATENKEDNEEETNERM